MSRPVWVALAAAITVAVVNTPTIPGGAWGLAAAALVGATLLAWLAWQWEMPGHADAALLTGICLLGAAASAITAPGPAIAFAGVGLARLGQRVPTPRSVPVVAGAVLVFIAVAALHTRSWSNTLGFAIILPGAWMVGLTRRDYVLRTQSAEQRAVDAERAREEHAHAAALAERSRMAREIHDVLAHSLAGLAVQLEAADALLARGDGDDARGHVIRARALATEGLAESRRAVAALRGDVASLPQRLQSLVADVVRDTGRVVRLDVGGLTQALSADADLAVYRTVQEGITNAVRYSGGDVDVRVGCRDGTVRTEVASALDGGGTHAADRASAARPGYGIAGARERAALLGGTISAGPVDGRWVLALEVPV